MKAIILKIYFFRTLFWKTFIFYSEFQNIQSLF